MKFFSDHPYNLFGLTVANLGRPQVIIDLAISLNIFVNFIGVLYSLGMI